ncbi:hypothetical protein Ae168Ps1_0521 [Pseudonocardia sp. Ae168_Ps1]|nr:hypothetical protein Ae150APs1_0526 [Pseudonocardia sp. Ae150A_Ps1]OLL78115.1 hypothetical protein Ae168Ps1_0521 [Pseudonocardia sp. Ae168_Ps1]OLL87761.1 hypothetical protein Ae263Ps1_4816c [Pseudonocardia sp. Ae263_Ps1]OLL92213.1 hypothetical protein Ae356Ps1_2110 [Pseudonocardia sp. Ae356_Ps1]
MRVRGTESGCAARSPGARHGVRVRGGAHDLSGAGSGG